MSDDKSDPWKFLASELGVDVTSEPPPPPPPPAPTPTKSAHSTAPAPAKKPTSDWSLLAGELGIEVPPEPESPSKKPDPVAELLGWQNTPARPPEEPETTRYVDDDLEVFYSRDDRPSRGDHRRDRHAPADRWQRRDDSVERDEGMDDFSEIESVESEDAPRQRSDERGRGGEERSGRRRRRRGGRGRGGDRRDAVDRGRDRPQERRDYDEPVADEADVPRDFEDESLDAEPRQEGEAFDAQDREPNNQERRGRRRRRGRRGGRGRGGERQAETQSAPSRQDDEDFGEQADFDGVGPSDDVSDLRTSDDHSMDDALEPAGDRGHGRNSVRDICTWREAVGMIIEGNMQSRSRGPQNGANGGGGGGGRGGQHRGRGRGRGRRGN